MQGAGDGANMAASQSLYEHRAWSFTPEKTPRTSRSKSPVQEAMEQKARRQERFNAVMQQRAEKEVEGCSFKPELSKRSLGLVDKNPYLRAEPLHSRGASKSPAVSKETSEDPPISVMNEVSRILLMRKGDRHGPVHERLIEFGKKAKEKSQGRLQELQMQEQKNSTFSPKIDHNSERLVLSRDGGQDAMERLTCEYLQKRREKRERLLQEAEEKLQQATQQKSFITATSKRLLEKAQSTGRLTPRSDSGISRSRTPISDNGDRAPQQKQMPSPNLTRGRSARQSWSGISSILSDDSNENFCVGAFDFHEELRKNELKTKTLEQIMSKTKTPSLVSPRGSAEGIMSPISSSQSTPASLLKWHGWNKMRAGKGSQDDSIINNHSEKTSHFEQNDIRLQMQQLTQEYEQLSQNYKLLESEVLALQNENRQLAQERDVARKQNEKLRADMDAITEKGQAVVRLNARLMAQIKDLKSKDVRGKQQPLTDNQLSVHVHFQDEPAEDNEEH
ncbi:hypothetical protein GUITHDRAFT_103341 [Guillardia theta CCMP2712]|uniref:Uncharacterized protein n=1 Tax=Guillardia theta (strain CCMP2712) TaxID=905079 RepID=L1JRD6_GUITC|nr:hypothetical protein GUITHDRAFT_103341 [Guillardia theta CCMP2712]EKX50750.1 hypothetical protein GUITHDRAFT_103341 [Guillardia theta CCMP2712]|eukprot:XP_005837730.1 hypothetical protein GUITHDRAFT_103341 [Guillardia theta CCMP2712]